MKFENHFLKEDIPKAENAFYNLINAIKIVEKHKPIMDEMLLKSLSNQIVNALHDLNELAVKKSENNQMYLHQIMSKQQGWFVH